MGFLDKLLTAGAAVGLGVLARAHYPDAQETQRRKKSQLHFDNVLTQRGFIELASDIGKRTPRVADVVVTGMTVTIRVRSISGLSTWKAEIDFNDYGHLTGKYWLGQDNADSLIPKHFADAVKAEVETRVGRAASEQAQAPPRPRMNQPLSLRPAPSANVSPRRAAPGTAPGSMRDKKASGARVIIAWVVAVSTLGYMLPWAIAESRGKSNSVTVGLVNLLAGWTVIGWVVALAMACGSHQVAYAPWAQQQPGSQGPPPPGFYRSPDGSGGQAYWNGRAWASPFS